MREMVENMRIRVPYVRTADNLADFFTKPLPAKQFFAMRNRIMNVENPCVGSRGGVKSRASDSTKSSASV